MPSSQELQAALERIARLPLAQYPTPLEPLPQISKLLDRQVYVKRDDGIGPGTGGNKTRKLEYLLAHASARRAHKVVTFGGLQSNHARITALAARHCGLQAHIFYFQRQPARLTGNLLLARLSGATMHFLPLGGGDGTMTLEATGRLVRLVAWLRVGAHYFIPVGGHSWRGCLGYVRAAIELDQQARSLGIEDAWLLLAAGTGGTLAGLLAGLTLVNSAVRPLGIDVGKLWKGFPASIARLTMETCRRLGFAHTFTAEQVPLIEDTYVGAGYGKPTPGGMEAVRLVAQNEGLLLDPIYTGKAFAGLLELAQGGRLGRDTPVIFLHSGGAPALFAGQE